MSEPTLQDWMDAYARFVAYRMNAMGLGVEDLAKKSSLPVTFIEEVLRGERCLTHKARTLLEGPLGASLEFVEPKVRGNS